MRRDITCFLIVYSANLKINQGLILSCRAVELGSGDSTRAFAHAIPHNEFTDRHTLGRKPGVIDPSNCEWARPAIIPIYRALQRFSQFMITFF